MRIGSKRYRHPVLVVDSFVDPERFQGTVYTANGWKELGLTDGWGRHARDCYVKHGKPKRLFVREPKHGGGHSILTAVTVPANITWAARSWTARPTKFPSPANSSNN